MTAIETRERFLRAIAERLSADRVEELHLFPPLRQGGVESAVAVIAARLVPPAPDLADVAPSDVVAESPADEPISVHADVPVDIPQADGQADAAPPNDDAPARLTVYRAHYRLVVKGPERGAWEMGLIEEADAPPPTVGVVVRGVHERAGGDDEPERLTGDAFRIAISDRPWATGG
jgi:hypothetical protein